MSLQAKEQIIVFSAGCFWGVEKHFEQIPGVLDTKAGYAGGNYPNPDYNKVLEYRNNPPKGIVNYAESVKVVFDDTKVTAKELIKSFWQMHDPTQGNRQGNDIGNNYRSAIFYTNENQHKIALETEKEYQTLLSAAGYGKITTQIKPLIKFYDAEQYHQNYLKKNPNGYCPDDATGVKFKKEIPHKQSFVKPLGGKEIIVIDAPFCPYCEQFKKDVTSSYKGSIPLRTVNSDKLKGFDITTKLNVAFNKGTDSMFCKKYDIFKNTPDGVFVDKLSGEVLFDTRDRFNSHSGWLSFYKAVKGATIEKEDNSYGMHRMEVIAKMYNAFLKF